MFRDEMTTNILWIPFKEVQTLFETHHTFTILAKTNQSRYLSIILEGFCNILCSCSFQRPTAVAISQTLNIPSLISGLLSSIGRPEISALLVLIWS